LEGETTRKSVRDSRQLKVIFQRGFYMRLFKYRRILTLLCGFSSLCISATLFAKPVTLYEQPKTDSKIVGTIDSASSMVPIFSNKEGDWMKVGDPQNGNVGWIKVNDVAASNTANGVTSTGFSMSEKTVNTSNGPKTYRVMQFGNTPPLTPEQSQAVTAAMQKRQVEIQSGTMQMLQSVIDNANAAYKANPNLYNSINFPFIVPVVVVPVANQPTANPPNPVAPASKKPQ
jgi:hypothetical protein